MFLGNLLLLNSKQITEKELLVNELTTCVWGPIKLGVNITFKGFSYPKTTYSCAKHVLRGSLAQEITSLFEVLLFL